MGKKSGKKSGRKSVPSNIGSWMKKDMSASTVVK